MSPVTTIFDPKPSRVRNIFICSPVVFCASSRMMNASLSVLCVSRKSSVTYSESVGSDLNAYCFFGACRLDAVNETHWPTAAGGVVLRYLAGESEWGHALRQTDIEDVGVGAVVHRLDRVPVQASVPVLAWFGRTTTPPSDCTRKTT